MHRFYAPALDPGDQTTTLPRDESEHLMRVLRLGIGDTVAVFDGRGREFHARVVGGAPREVRLQIVGRIEPVPELPVALTLVQAVLKGDRMDEVVRDAVMLGVAAVQPLVTTRTETTIAALLRGARGERWKRVALASAKQCRRAVLPEIRVPLSLDSYLLEPADAVRLMFVEPSVEVEAEPFEALRDEPAPAEAVLLVGPEGGWTRAEAESARDRGARLVSLGYRTLRADAVPLVALGVLAFLWGGSPRRA